jgi:serine phosphatase RsbU (regulator of sigma subunit)
VKQTHHFPKFFSLAVCLWLTVVVAQAQPVFTLTAEQLQNGQAVELDKLDWKYSPNDEPRFADPQFDDRAWETISATALNLDNLPQSGWQGIGWFRLRLRVDEATAQQPLSLLLEQWGASEIWLDGHLLQSVGKIGVTPETEVESNPRGLVWPPISFVLESGQEHLLAIRHSCAVLQANPYPLGRVKAVGSSELYVHGRDAGIHLALMRTASAISSRESATMASLTFIVGIWTLYSVLGLLHLILFAFYPRQKASLWFGLLALSFTLTQIGNYIWKLTRPGLYATQYFYFNLFLASTLGLIFLLGFLYTVSGKDVKKNFWVIALVVVVVRFAPFFFPDVRLFYWSTPIFLLCLIFEMFRVVASAIRRKVMGAWYVGVPLLLILVFPLNDALMNLGINLNQTAVNYLGGGTITVLATITISVFLARQFARTSLSLEEQLVQVKRLSAAALEHEKVKAENERRAAELEEARQLQLSMLPKKLPQLPHLDIAAYMKTASEVGGDYYDFHLGSDDTLTIAVGDATGHGLKAGTLVASVKSLFASLAYHPDIPHIFQRISAVLKEMKLRGLFMAMTMVKVNGYRMTVSIAGMPSVLIYRAASNQVEEIAMRALPLGGLTKYQYQQQDLILAANDVVVLMSDGLPERFNPQDEMLDYERIRHALPALASQSSEAIITALIHLGEEWGAGRGQDDDITFVVLKISANTLPYQENL